MLTVKEINEVSFGKAGFSGYKPEDVDNFIDEVVESFTQLLAERDDALQQEAQLDQQVKELTNQVATGYNVGSSAMGASGQGLSAGYVAVHPGEIPYGTRMYITSADNSFVYGFAIAADTGLGLLGDVIDVDLYYDTYLESCLNGKRNVNIYLLN